MKHPGPPEPWPDGIDVVVPPGPHTLVEGCFAPGAVGLMSALKKRGIAVAAIGDLRHTYSYADLGWYGPTILYAAGTLWDGTIAILADAVLTAATSGQSRGNETTRAHLTVGHLYHDRDRAGVGWLDFRGPAEDLAPALRRWINRQSISACP